MDNCFNISIIIPVYNVEEYIEDTLNSILNQSFENYEVIIINDGSTDKTLDKINSIKDKFKNIKIINQDNSGPSTSRNKGIELANGEYIIFVDGDDILPKDSLKTRYEEIKKYNVDVLIGKTKKFNGQREWEMGNQIDDDIRVDIYEDKRWLWTLGPCNKIFSSKLIKNIKFPIDLKYGEDQVFVIEAIIQSKYIYYSSKVIYLYRERNLDTENVSLTNQSKIDASNVLKQIKYVWDTVQIYVLNNVKKENQESILKTYFKRLVCSDIWPTLFIGIKSRDSLKTLIEANNIFSNVNEKYIESLSNIKKKTINLIKNKEINKNYRVIIRKVTILNTIPKLINKIKLVKKVFN